MVDPEKILDALPEDERNLLRESYLSFTHAAIHAADKYSGVEDQYEGIMENLIALENWMRENFPEDPHNPQRLNPDREKMLNELFNPDHDSTIDSLLGYTAGKFEAWLKGEGGIERFLEELGVCLIELDGVILPPGSGYPPIEPNPDHRDKAKSKEIKVILRLQELIAFLNINKIFIDDLIIYPGKLFEDQMRELTYYIVEIPRINKQIIVCDQVGEGTLVIDGCFNTKTLTSLSKDKLMATYPDRITQVVYRNRASWEEGLYSAIFKDNVTADDPKTLKHPRKLNVKELAELRAELQRNYTAEQWVKLKSEEIRKVEACGMKLIAIGTVFGIEDNVLSKQAFLQLGLVIFGGDNLLIRAALEKEKGKTFLREKRAEVKSDDPDLWRAKIIAEYPPKKWLTLEYAQLRSIMIDGLDIVGIARLLGYTGTLHSIPDYLEVAALIYGEDDPIIKPKLDLERANASKRKELGQNLGKWRTEVRKHMSAKEWADLPCTKARDKDFYGVSMLQLAYMFGVEGSVYSSKLSLLELGAAIYGPNHPAIKPALNDAIKCAELGDDLDKWRAVIKSRYTIEQWVRLSKTERAGIDIYGKGMFGLATIFKLKIGNVFANNHSNMCILAAEIYGKDDPIVKMFVEKDLDIWRKELKAKYDVKKWIDLKIPDARKVDIYGVNIFYIAEVFGVSGDPVHSRLQRLELGVKIFGDDNLALNTVLAKERVDTQKREELSDDMDKWRVEITSIYTIKKWVNFNFDDARSINFYGVYRAGLAKIFKISEETLEIPLWFHLELGAKIYGEKDPILKPLLDKARADGKKLLELGKDPDKWRVEIMSRYTAAGWASMPPKERNEMNFYGHSKVYISRIFGLIGSTKEVRLLESHFELGEKIFGVPMTPQVKDEL